MPRPVRTSKAAPATTAPKEGKWDEEAAKKAVAAFEKALPKIKTAKDLAAAVHEHYMTCGYRRLMRPMFVHFGLKAAKGE